MKLQQLAPPGILYTLQGIDIMPVFPEETTIIDHH